MDPQFKKGLCMQARHRPGPNLLKHEFRAMGVQMLAALETDAPLAMLSLEQVPRWFEEWEQILSRFRADSELSRLNRSVGQRVPVSADLWEVLQISLWAAEYTGGLVTPTVLTALEIAGYDRTFEALASSSSPAPVPAPAGALTSPQTDPLTCAVPDWRLIELDPVGRTVHLPMGVRLDFGGTAKGWAADRAALLLGEIGPALVDAGGDIAVSGPMVGGAPWSIGVADPLHPDSDLALLYLSYGGVATSGRDYRRWHRGGREMHHIIDPRTAQPARTDLLSVTVVGPSALAAEVAAKAVLILGSDAGMDWLGARPGLEALLVGEDGALLCTPGFPRRTEC